MRKSAFGFVVSCFFLTLPVLAQEQQPDWDKVQVKIQKVSGNVYLLQGFGGNAAAFLGDDGIVLIDCEQVQLGAKIEAALKTVSDKPVKYVLDTHWHGDHTGGNAYFGKSAIIIAQDNVRKKIETVPDRRITNLAVSLPVITFNDQLTLHMNGAEIRAVHFAQGHTDGDSAVFFPQANVVDTGDLFINWDPPRFPGIDFDRDGGGGPQGEIAAAEYVLARTPDDVKIIPGHGNLASKADLTKHLTLLKDTSAAVQAGINQGKTLDQLKQEKVLAKWEYLEKNGGLKSEVYLERLYNSLSQKTGSVKSGVEQ
jgi:cyclase